MSTFYFIKVSEDKKDGNYELTMDSNYSLSNIRHLLHDIILKTGIGKINIPFQATDKDLENFSGSSQPFTTYYFSKNISDLVDKTIEHYNADWDDLKKDDYIVIMNYDKTENDMGNGRKMEENDFLIYKNILLKKKPEIKDKLAEMQIDKPDKLDNIINMLQDYCDN